MRVRYNTFSRGKGVGQNGERPRRRLPLPLLVALDVLAAALLLGVFYVTNYVIRPEVTPVALPTPAAPTPAPTALATAAPAHTGGAPTASPAGTAATAMPAPTAAPNDWRAKFAGKFTGGQVEKTANAYRSANVSITVEEIEDHGVTCYVADIHVAELKYFKTAFAKKPDKMGYREMMDITAGANGAVLAVNGDHCLDNPGMVIRNGQLYRKQKTSMDILVMRHDGSMQAFFPDEFDMQKYEDEGAYQVWVFGPVLLRDGQPMEKFNATKAGTGVNPRTAIGYYEPGHYCFVQVGGRGDNGSVGYTLAQLTQLFQDLGCTLAYNLDGGRSSEIYFQGKVLNTQSPRRSSPDILYITDN